MGAVFTNSIPIGGVTGTGGSGGVGNGSAAAVSVTMIAAASVTKAFAPASVVQGGTSTLTVTLSNQSGASLTNAAITDPLPAGVIVAATPATSTTCTGGTVTAIPGGSSVALSGATIPTAGCNFKVNVVGNTVGTRINTIPAGALTNDQSATNPNAASANLTVTSGLTATKSFTPSTVANGGVSQVRLRITNPSGTPFTNLSLTDGPMVNMVVATPARGVDHLRGLARDHGHTGCVHRDDDRRDAGRGLQLRRALQHQDQRQSRRTGRTRFRSARSPPPRARRTRRRSARR